MKIELQKSTAFLKTAGLRSAVFFVVFLAAQFSLSSLFVSQAKAASWFAKNTDEKDANIVDPVRYSVSIQSTNLSAEDADKLRDVSQLIADEAKPTTGSLGLYTKANSDRDLLVGALYEQARYGGVVSISINGKELDEISPTIEFSKTSTNQVLINIDGGKVFNFGKVKVVGSPSGLGSVALVSGSPARSDIILQEQEKIIADLKADGHPYAQVSDSIIEADHNAGVLDVTLIVDPGPKADFGETNVVGAQTVDADFIARHANIQNGHIYNPQELAAAQKRLRELDVFDTVTVSEGEELDANGQVPIIIDVKERKHRYLGLGATWSNTDGVGIEGYWGHRNLFGQAEKLRIEGSVSRIGEAEDLNTLNFSTAILFEKPAALGPKSTFTANVRAVSENFDAFERRSVRGGFGYRFELDKRQTLSAALDLDWSRITENKIESRHLIASIPIEYQYDGSDDKLDPTKGYRLAALLEPATDFENGATFVKGRVTVSGYFTPDEDGFLTLAARTSVGSIVGANLGDVAADRRFYAGGGGSTRGFAFQSVGPRDASGKPTGGLGLFEASLEARMQITESLGLVPFLDFGSISRTSAPDFSDIRIGAGLGLRYKTPFGPLRLDVGVPLDRRKGEDAWAVYAGIGQSF